MDDMHFLLSTLNKREQKHKDHRNERTLEKKIKIKMV